MMRAAMLLGCAAALALSGCRLDPVVQDEIDDLPPEDQDPPTATHRQGQPCVLCHSEYEGAEPAMALGGTVYEQNPATFQLIPVPGVRVYVFDSNGASQLACTNAGGNFYIEQAVWTDAAFPLTVQVGNRYMRSLVGRERSCAGCHELPRPSQLDPSNAAFDSTIDPSTGFSSRSSAGAVLVNRLELSPLQVCIPPGGTGGAGGSGGAGGEPGTGGAGGEPGAGGTGGAPGTGGTGGTPGTGGSAGGGGS